MTYMNEQFERILKDMFRDWNLNNTYRGYRDTIMAMRLVWTDEDNLHPMNQKIYAVITERTGRSQSAVASAIRRTAQKCWDRDKQFFQNYDDSLLAAPSNVKFLEILLWFLHDTIAVPADKPNRTPYGKDLSSSRS